MNIFFCLVSKSTCGSVGNQPKICVFFCVRLDLTFANDYVRERNDIQRNECGLCECFLECLHRLGNDIHLYFFVFLFAKNRWSPY